MHLSIVIPTLNEEENIARLVQYLRKISDSRLVEIIVVNAAATKDRTAQVAAAAGARVITSAIASRAVQMNLGAEQAKGEVFYFVHADVLPPTGYLDNIEKAIQRGYAMGYFSYQHDCEEAWLKINGYFTRFDGIFTGGGDQTHFIRKEDFWLLNGFDENCLIMEDFDFIRRARKAKLPYIIIKNDALVSARKYKAFGYAKVNIVNFIAFCMFHLGVAQPKIVRTYKRLLR